MLKTRKIKSLAKGRRLIVSAVLSIAIIGGTIYGGLVRADQYDTQIQQLEQQNASNQAAADNLASQASSYQDAINKLEIQINGLQQAIVANQQASDQLQQQIDTAQAQLAQEKKTLGESIRAMYLEGQTSTLEVLASSENISDFVNKQTYRNAVQDQVKTTLDKINALKLQLTQKQHLLQAAIKSQQAQQTQLSSAENQQSQMLAFTEGQKAAYDSQIQNNNAQIAQLRAEQIAANRRLVNSGGGSVLYSGSCGGGYPAVASGPYGNWGCNYPLDNTIDNWGMYNRECVSYAAWMVYKTYGYMPYWGGVGDANQWPGDAQAAGIPIGYTPKVGSVAIYMGGSGDPWGHAMWVTAVNGNMITVQQYNLYYDGNYYVTTIDGSGLTYIYFGG